jgi:alkylated DNA repair dioxygenase AlkB
MKPDAQKWVTLLNDVPRRSRLRHMKQAIHPDMCSKWYATVAGTEEDTVFSKVPGMPRKTAWLVRHPCRCEYGYGQFTVKPKPYPEWMDELLGEIMPLLGATSRAQWPDSCNLNLYEGGKNSVNWHADDENIFQGKKQDIMIVSLTLGADRTFSIGTQHREEKAVILGDGDLCTMEGAFQRYYQHAVLKDYQAKGNRINLTWRWVMRHNQNCPCNRQPLPLNVYAKSWSQEKLAPEQPLRPIKGWHTTAQPHQGPGPS